MNSQPDNEELFSTSVDEAQPMAENSPYLSPVSDLEELPVPEEPAGPSTWQTVKMVAREVIETVVLTLIIFLLIQTVIKNFRVVGSSMEPNLHDGQYLIIDKISYRFRAPQRGDVVVFEPPNRPEDDYVKRIIGLPGETVEVRQGQVFINGEPLEEDFVPRPGTYSYGSTLLEKDEVFVLGDNRNNSNDSHNWGPLHMDKIVGRAWVSYWPPSRWGLITRDTPTEKTALSTILSDLLN